MKWLFVFLPLLSSTGWAQIAGCAKDIRRFCIQVPNERLWVEKCLESNQNSLSAECLAQSGSKISWLARFADLCIHEREKNCVRVPPDKFALIQCLKDAQDVGPDCKEWIENE